MYIIIDIFKLIQIKWDNFVLLIFDLNPSNENNEIIFTTKNIGNTVP